MELGKEILILIKYRLPMNITGYKEEYEHSGLEGPKVLFICGENTNFSYSLLGDDILEDISESLIVTDNSVCIKVRNIGYAFDFINFIRDNNSYPDFIWDNISNFTRTIICKKDLYIINIGKIKNVTDCKGFEFKYVIFNMNYYSYIFYKMYKEKYKKLLSNLKFIKKDDKFYSLSVKNQKIYKRYKKFIGNNSIFIKENKISIVLKYIELFSIMKFCNDVHHTNIEKFYLDEENKILFISIDSVFL